MKKITEIVASSLEELQARYTKAIASLDSEHAALEEESQGIQQAAADLRLILPAKARAAERAADELLLKGKHKEAQAKRDEQQQAEAAPAKMEQRRRDIDERVAEIYAEKRKIARRVFQEWFEEFRDPMVEAQTDLISSLETAWVGINRFAAETDTIRQPGSILTAGLRGDLVARDRGPEKTLFDALQNWFQFGFGGR